VGRARSGDRRFGAKDGRIWPHAQQTGDHDR
jgi:hypothetical protein